MHQQSYYWLFLTLNILTYAVGLTFGVVGILAMLKYLRKNDE